MTGLAFRKLFAFHRLILKCSRLGAPRSPASMAKFQVQGLHSFKPYRIGYSPSASLRYLTMKTLRFRCLSNLPCIPDSLKLPKPKNIVFPYHTTWVRSFTVCKTKGSDMISQLEIEKPEERRTHEKQANGIFWIILLNLGIFAADHLFQVREIKSLYLYHNFPTWYQFFTATFCHANWKHLSSNLFFLYIFGKLVEEEEGNFALWCSYILTGIGANLVSWLVLPRNAISVGASGAVFGLFTISVLVKMSWDWRKILEVLILGQFVIEKVMEAAQASTALSGIGGSSLQSVNHIAHLSGALVGVLLVWLLSKIPSDHVD